jgi:tetratricopeptide (TPR) repeat protein
MELSYAESNLGILLYDQRRFAEADRAFAAALRIMEAVAAKEKPSAARQLEMGIAINWLGKAKLRLNRADDALALHRREIVIYQSVLRSEPSNTQAKLREAVAWQHVSEIEQELGNLAASASANETSLSLIRALRLIEPANTEWQETELRAIINQIDNFYYGRKITTAESAYQAGQALLAKMRATDSKNTIWSVDLQTAMDIRGARLALVKGETATALALAQGVLRRLAEVKGFRGEETTRFAIDAETLAGDALARLGRKPEAAKVWQTGLNRIAGNDLNLPTGLLRRRFLLLKRVGRYDEAALIKTWLDRQGYRHPAYLRER